MAIKFLRDNPEWKRILNQYRNVDDITIEDWETISICLSKIYFVRIKNPVSESTLDIELIEENFNSYFDLIRNLTSQNIYGERHIKDIDDNISIDFMGKPIDFFINGNYFAMLTDHGYTTEEMKGHIILFVKNINKKIHNYAK